MSGGEESNNVTTTKTLQQHIYNNTGNNNMLMIEGINAMRKTPSMGYKRKLKDIKIHWFDDEIISILKHNHNLLPRKDRRTHAAIALQFGCTQYHVDKLSVAIKF